MDILSHTFSGLAVGTVAMQFTKGIKAKGLVLFCSTLGGFFPDLDAISYWSDFDRTIGSFFNLTESGPKIYHAKHWYSHHAFNHSLPAAILYGTIILGVIKLIKKSAFNWKKALPISLGFVFGFLAHVYEDMPTPDFAWGGVAFLFPSENYWGGKGYIWWWNNYDLFLIIFSTGMVNLLISILSKWIKLKPKLSCSFIFLIGVGLYLTQMFSRPLDFQYSGFSGHHKVWSINEAKSKEIQKEILGEDLYEFMEALDNEIPFYF